MKILGISGSLRRESHNTALLRAAADRLPSGVQLEVWDRLRDLPHYDADLDVDPVPAAVADLRAAIGEADAVLIATPEFNGSIPGVLKNAIDWASRPYPGSTLQGKPALVLGASTGLFGAVWAQAELRKVLGVAGADVRGEEDGFPVGQAQHVFGPDGSVQDPELHERLEAHLAPLHAEAVAARR